MNQAAEENEFRRAMNDLLADIERERNPPMPGPFEEGPKQLILEHGTRVLFFDRFMTLLGWRLGTAGDVAEEVRIKAESTQFIDYVGLNAATRAPVLIFEAKAWDKAFVRAAQGKPKATDKQLMVAAIQHVNAGKDSRSSPVVIEWHEYLNQVAGYVETAKRRYAHDVPCAVLASGEWMVVFTNPVRTFCDQVVHEDDIRIFQGKEFLDQAVEIYRLLSRERLAAIAPEHIRPTQITQYLTSEQIAATFQAVLVTYHSKGSAIFQPTPQVLVYPALLLQRTDNLLFTVVDGGEPTQMDLDYIDGDQADGLLTGHIDAVGAKSAALLKACETELNCALELSTLADFPGFNGNHAGALLGSAALAKTYVRPLRQNHDEWFIVTGQTSHFLHDRPTLTCRFHTWAASRQVQMEFGSNAVNLPSTSDPRAFFIDGAQHHCAHRTIIDRRHNKCLIAPLDRRTCCRACVFQGICWTDAQRADLPCGT